MAIGAVDWFLIVLPDGTLLADGGMVLVFTNRVLAEWVAEQRQGKIRRAVRADQASIMRSRQTSGD